MNKPFQSLYGQMIFTLLTGTTIHFVPNTILSIFGLTTTNEPWIRVLGLLILALSIYYFFMAKYADKKIAWATVYTRIFFCLGMFGMISIGLLPKIIILLPLVESGLTIWTWREISKPQFNTDSKIK